MNIKLDNNHNLILVVLKPQKTNTNNNQKTTKTHISN